MHEIRLPYLMLGILPICFPVLCGHLLLKALSNAGIHVPTSSLGPKIVDRVAEKMLFEEV
jgi:hypothetical protein